MRAYVVLALIPLAACHAAESKGVAGTGAGGNRSFAVDGFSAVEATGPDDVDVRVGPGFSIRAEGDAKILDKLEIVKNGDTLEVRRKSSSGFSWGSGGHVKVYVTMPRITAASSTGSGDLAVDRVEGADFKADATGSGDLSVGSVAVQSISLSVTGSGSVAAAGTARTGKFSVTGSGDVDAAKLSVGSADVGVMGSGGVTAAVAGPAKVDVMGSGDVTLTGGARCTTAKMGSGSVTCG